MHGRILHVGLPYGSWHIDIGGLHNFDVMCMVCHDYHAENFDGKCIQYYCYACCDKCNVVIRNAK